MNGYANALAFQAITDDEIASIETFVREEMYNYLIRNTAEAINEHDESILTDDDDVLITKEQLIDHFGKIYATDPMSFRFQSGEIVLIREMVNHVKAKLGTQQKNGLKLFKTNRPKKEKKFSAKSSMSEMNAEKLKFELTQRVIESMKIYGAETFFEDDMDCGVGDNTVEVRVQKGVGVYGNVRCEICETQNNKKKKPKRVYYDDNSQWPCWVMSNFTRHLKNVHKLEAQKSKSASVKKANKKMKVRKSNTRKSKSALATSPDKQFQTGSQEKLNESDVVFVGVEKEETPHAQMEESVQFIVNDSADIEITHSILHNQTNDTNGQTLIFTQLTSQINAMMTTVLENAETCEEMGFLINETMQKLNVATTKPDGNCLFSSIAHQLYRLKINSKPHESKIRQLRQRVVEYILDPNNFPKFFHDLKDRVYERKKKDDIADMETECKLYVENCLAKNSVWGGTETIYAACELEKVNVLIFNENGHFYTLSNTKQYDRTICIAYRLLRDEYGDIIEGTRFHYDSVCDIDSSTLYNAAKSYESRQK